LSSSGTFLFEIETPNNKLDLVRFKDNYGREGKPYEDDSFEYPKQNDCLSLKDLQEQEKLLIQQHDAIKPNFDPNRNTRGRTTYFKDEEVMAQSEDFKNAFKKENLKEVYNKFYNGDVKKFQTDMRQFVASLPSIKKAWDQIYSESFNSPDYVEKLVEKNFSADISDGYKRLKSNPNENPALLAEIETTAKTREKANILLKIPGYSFAEKVSSIFGYKIEFIMEDIKDPKWFGTLRNSISNDLIEIEEELEGHTDTINALAISPCGNLLASGSFDKSIIIWDF
jgi:hypothetical protein